MRNSLTNPNQCRAFEVMIFDDPTNKYRSLGIDTDDIFVPFHMKGTTCGTTTLAPTYEEIKYAPRIYL